VERAALLWSAPGGTWPCCASAYTLQLLLGTPLKEKYLRNTGATGSPFESKVLAVLHFAFAV